MNGDEMRQAPRYSTLPGSQRLCLTNRQSDQRGTTCDESLARGVLSTLLSTDIVELGAARWQTAPHTIPWGGSCGVNPTMANAIGRLPASSLRVDVLKWVRGERERLEVKAG